MEHKTANHSSRKNTLNALTLTFFFLATVLFVTSALKLLQADYPSAIILGIICIGCICMAIWNKQISSLTK